MKKLKPAKSRITLKDGRELHYHLPHAKVAPISLKSLLPANTACLEVEIGSGKGEFIAKRAKEFPERTFAGIDRRPDRHQLTERKLSRVGHKNWVVINEDARCFLNDDLPTLEVLHVYHPDPWPKNRHHKHRFFRSPDAKRWAEAIRKNGTLRISTDHREYFEEILDIVESWQLFKTALVFKKDARSGEPSTHFEGIFFRKKEPVYKAQFVRI